MLDIKRKISSISFLFLLFISCKDDVRISEKVETVDKVLIETDNGHQITFKEFNFYKTKLGAVYLEILDNKNDLLNNRLKKASLIINGNFYNVKVIKQFFDNTIIGDSFFLTVDNKTGKLIIDVIDGKNLILIGFENNIKKIVEKESVAIIDI